MPVTTLIITRVGTTLIITRVGTIFIGSGVHYVTPMSVPGGRDLYVPVSFRYHGRIPMSLCFRTSSNSPSNATESTMVKPSSVVLAGLNK